MKHLPSTKQHLRELTMARHRIEDLGRIFERLDLLVDHETFQHDLEWAFMESMKDEDKREEHYHVLRALRDELYEVRQIAAGEDLLNESTV